MPSHPVQSVFLTGRQSLIWLLAVALLVYGHSATMVQLLGPAHRHELSAAGTSAGLLDRMGTLFRDVRAWRAELQDRWIPEERAHVHAEGVVHSHGHVFGGPPQASVSSGHHHAHSVYQRHSHDPKDNSVVALDGLNGDSVADTASQAAAGSATLPLALAPGWNLPLPGVRSASWAAQAADRWRNAVLRLSERPPRS